MTEQQRAEKISELLTEGFEIYFSNPTRGLELATEGIELARAGDLPEKVARSEMLAAYSLEFLSRSNEAIEKATSAARYFAGSGDRTAEANGYNAIGIASRSLSLYADSLLSFQNALRIFQELEDEDRSAATRNNIGSVYEMIGDYDRAIEEYLAALEYYRVAGPRKYEGLVAGNVGNIYYSMDDLENAEKWHRQALEISRETEDRLGEATLRLNISSINRSRGDIEGALELIRPALEIARSLGHRRIEGAILAKRAILEEEKGDREEALKTWDEAGEILKEVEAEREYADVLVRRGEALLKDGGREEGRKLLEEGRDIYFRIGDRKAEIEGLQALARFYEEEGDLHAALEAERRIRELYVEIKGEERERSVAAMQARFDVAQRELERAHFEARATEQQRLAEERSKELNSAAMLLIRKNSLLQTIREELEGIRESGDVKQLSKTFSRIDQSIRSDDDWKRFEETYRLVHHDFISRLSARFPELSPTELKVAALLHIDLSNKEIADLLCISLRTVESHRYNIRKKLNLPGSANLAVQIEACVGEEST